MNLREASKAIYNAQERPTHDDLRTGCFQRIADATELMAKRHQELIAEAESHKVSRDYWQGEHDSMARRLIAAKGQITKLKRKAVGAAT